jgi:hypothetical protein
VWNDNQEEYKYVLNDVVLSGEQVTELDSKRGILEEIKKLTGKVFVRKDLLRDFSYQVVMTKKNEQYVTIQGEVKGHDQIFNKKFPIKRNELENSEKVEVKALKEYVQVGINAIDHWSEKFLQFFHKFIEKMEKNEKDEFQDSVIMFDNASVTDGMVILDIEGTYDHLRDISNSGHLVFPEDLD